MVFYKDLKTEVTSFLQSQNIDSADIGLFDRLLTQDIYAVSEENIFSSGYVLDTLEASIWCLLTTETYKDAVLKAVNLGEDTDTTGAVTGGLAGLLYGFGNIPQEWISQIARKEDIENLGSVWRIKQQVIDADFMMVFKSNDHSVCRIIDGVTRS